ncbi:hypothetical protein KY343_01610 [Candidatus Woesearchaeota archaeon]|nr:hypothetical protein [Candidatus Woesearchaeota archaeon]
MIKRIILIILLVSILFLVGCTQTDSIGSTIKTQCPIGLVNDEYPGSCAKYIDRNNNNICDLSE